MHFQEVTASLLLSERRGHCEQFEITQPKGHEQNPDTGMGVIQQQILEAIYEVERDNNQICSLIYGVRQGCLWAIHLMPASVQTM
jgi:hypothetical protein